MKPDITDLAALKDLLLWAREERILLSQVTIGEVTIVAQDLQIGETMAKRRVAEGAQPAATLDAYARYGGDLLTEAMQRLAATEQPTAPQTDTTTYEDDDED